MNEKRRQLRQAKRCDTYTKATVTQAFGGCAVSEDAPVFQAALGFMKGCQLKNRSSTNGTSTRYFVGRRCSVVDKSPEKRCMNKNRKKILHDMVRHMYDGYIVKEVERSVLKRKRFSTVNFARVSDMHSTFNASAVGSIAKCEGGKVKGEMGLLCSETTLRRTMDGPRA
jgi:hypothetical protein